ncbi:DedA family protein [Paenibacillus lutrae]|uniref:DedA family protein n=1 Tax=Paenibacillus lutrae TaxID=2078573 RepID=A0A7X3K0Q0_9BACL|nr:DedA family protein [Paenibacillus lutrae]MVP01342.1 DedA family protein [Paenibacillus lutrae]
MNDTILQLVDQYGYFIFFLALALGPFGIPVPNEVTVMTAGMIGDSGLLNPWLVYSSTLSGLLVALTAGYGLGKYFGPPLLRRLRRNERFSGYYSTAESLLDKYGSAALCVSTFIPIVRYLLPVFMGAAGKPYKKFAVYAYSGALVWTLLVFGLGVLWGESLTALLARTEIKTALIVAILASGVFVIWKKGIRKSQSGV